MLVQTTRVIDPATGLEMAIVDTTALRGQLPEAETVLAAAAQLPQVDHAIVFFASGAPTAPNLPWLHRIYRTLPRTTKKRIRRVYLVHGNWWARALHKVLGGTLSPKFTQKVVLVPTLSALATHLDVRTLDISPQVYLDNMDAEDFISLPQPTAPTFGHPLPAKEPSNFWRQTLHYLWSLQAMKLEFFERTNGSPLVYVLREAFDRRQKLALGDYGPQLAIAMIKLYLLELPVPLVPLSRLPLPIGDGPEYTATVRSKLDKAANYHLGAVAGWLSHVNVTFRLPVREMVHYMTPAVVGLDHPTKDQSAVAERFLRNLVDQQLDMSIPGSLTPARVEQTAAATISLPTGELKAAAQPLEPLFRGKPAAPTNGRATRVASHTAGEPKERTHLHATQRSPIRTQSRLSSAPACPSVQLRSVPMVDVENLLPPPTQKHRLRAKSSLRNIRGERVLQMAQKFEPDEFEVDPSPL